MPLSPGTTLGPYQIDAPLGAGGMGEVYKATDTRLDRTVAIKVLPEHVASDPDLKQRFEREAKTVAGLIHTSAISRTSGATGKASRDSGRFQKDVEVDPHLVVDERRGPRDAHRRDAEVGR